MEPGPQGRFKYLTYRDVFKPTKVPGRTFSGNGDDPDPDKQLETSTSRNAAHGSVQACDLNPVVVVY